MALSGLLAACTNSTLEPPQRDGPPALVNTGEGAQLWLASRQEEERSRRIGGGRLSAGRWITDYYYHLRLQAHDPGSAQQRWLKVLKVVKDSDGGRSAQVRILGQQGELVWLWVHDQPLAVSARDAAVHADLARIEQANPALAGLFPTEIKFYTWVGEMVVTLADGRHVRLTLPDFRAEAYTVAAEAPFRNAGFMTSSWNGAWRTENFGVRHGVFDGRWIGLLSDREAKDAEDDTWGDHYADSAEIDDERQTARRAFRQATTGRTKAFSEGRHVRIAKLDRLPDSGTYLQGVMLKAVSAPGTPAFTLRGRIWKPTVQPPLRLEEPPGVLVLYRTRMDAQGTLALARTNAGFGELWRAPLPFDNLANRWQAAQQLLLLYGDWNAGQPGRSDMREALLSLDLATGRWAGWDVRAEKPLTP